MTSSQYRCGVILASCLVLLSFGGFARAGCLENFSCQLHGACQLPCLGAPDTPPQPAPALAPAAPIADTRDAKASLPGPSQTRPRKPIVARTPAIAKVKQADLHILATRDIGTVAQLSGRIVSFGPPGSLGEVNARRAFAALGIKVDETPLDFANAVDGLSTGDVAAVVTIEPQGSSRLKHLPGAAIHLLAVPSASAPPDGMRKAMIPARIYPALSHQDVATFAVNTAPKERGKEKRTQSAALAPRSP